MKMLQIDIELCLGCHSCELACAVEHSMSKQLSEAINESPLPGYRLSVIYLDGAAAVLTCRHCEDAPCIGVCPPKALVKSENGVVLLNDTLCVNCRLCLAACPFGVIYSDAEGKAVIKCDLCRERLSRGDDPACVTACPTKALRFIEPETFKHKNVENRKKMNVELRTSLRQGYGGQASNVERRTSLAGNTGNR